MYFHLLELTVYTLMNVAQCFTQMLFTGILKADSAIQQVILLATYELSEVCFANSQLL